MVGDVERLREKKVVAVIEFHKTTIYPTDASHGQLPEHVLAPDPEGHLHKVHHFAGNPKGTYEGDNSAYWKEVTDTLAPAEAILLLSHGGGKANASHHWVAYVEKHRPDVAAKISADVRVDVAHLDATQVLRLAQYYFGGPLLRDFGDARRGEPRSPRG